MSVKTLGLEGRGEQVLVRMLGPIGRVNCEIPHQLEKRTKHSL